MQVEGITSLDRRRTPQLAVDFPWHFPSVSSVAAKMQEQGPVQVGVTGYCFAADCILSFEAVKRRVRALLACERAGVLLMRERRRGAR